MRENKNKAHRRKHGIWFEETQSCLDDPNGLYYRFTMLPTLFNTSERNKIVNKIINIDYSGTTGRAYRINCIQSRA